MNICKGPDISETERRVMRKEFEKMYCNRLAVYVKQEVTDKITHVTRFEDSIRYANIPCRISEQNISVATDDEPARVSKQIKVILAPEIKIPPGSTILLDYHGYTGKFRQTGLPYVKSDTQTLILEFEGYA